MLRAAANVAVHALTELFPGSSAGIFGREAGRDTLRAVAVANVPDCWAMRAPYQKDVSRGFMLLDMLVVMVLIALLAGFVAPRYFAQFGKSQVKVARAQIDALDKALDQFRIDVGHYPTSEQGLRALVVQPSGEPNWAGRYLKKGMPPDPWGRQTPP